MFLTLEPDLPFDAILDGLGRPTWKVVLPKGDEMIVVNNFFYSSGTDADQEAEVRKMAKAFLDDPVELGDAIKMLRDEKMYMVTLVSRVQDWLMYVECKEQYRSLILHLIRSVVRCAQRARIQLRL